jgi:uncharacterized protein YegL
MSENHLEQVEFDSSNPEPRCACVLLLDTSTSMAGAPIYQLNEGLSVFQHELQRDELAAMRVEVAVVTFGGQVTIQQDFVSAHQFKAPTLTPSGDTPMGEAVQTALGLISRRKAVYKEHGTPYYRPWIFLLTDGQPTDEWRAAAQQVRQEESRKAVAFFAVGVQGADMATLKQIAVREPALLKGLQFRELFVWLSASLGAVAQSQLGEQVSLAERNWSVV